MTHIATTVGRAKALLDKPTQRRARLVYRTMAQIVCQARDVDNDVGKAHDLLGQAHRLLYPSN